MYNLNEEQRVSSFINQPDMWNISGQPCQSMRPITHIIRDKMATDGSRRFIYLITVNQYLYDLNLLLGFTNSQINDWIGKKVVRTMYTFKLKKKLYFHEKIMCPTNCHLK